VALRAMAPEAFSRGFSDRGILQLHRRMAVAPFAAILIAATLASLLTSWGHGVGETFMPTLAQVLPVLFLSQLIEAGFMAQRLSREVGDSPADAALMQQYIGISAAACLSMFLLGEGMAFIAVANGPSTFTVTLALLTGIVQAMDLTLGVVFRGGFGKTAFSRMLDIRN
jgi:hypothetical protein